MSLEDIKNELITLIQIDSEDIAHDDAIDEIGNLCEQLSHHYRALGICKLLIDGDTGAFYHDLIRSAKVREYYLSRCHAENYLTDPCMVASRIEPFFDAVAANQFQLASKLSSLSPNLWWKEDEYEDDFCYARFMQQYIGFNEVSDELKAILEQFEKSLEGDSSSRLELCKAFFANDQSAFDDAFAQLLKARMAEIEKNKNLAIGEEITFKVEQHIFVEGLAVLRLAEKAGFKTQKEYLYCPSLARLPMKNLAPANDLPLLEK